MTGGGEGVFSGVIVRGKNPRCWDLNPVPADYIYIVLSLETVYTCNFCVFNDFAAFVVLEIFINKRRHSERSSYIYEADIFGS